MARIFSAISNIYSKPASERRPSTPVNPHTVRAPNRDGPSSSQIAFHTSDEEVSILSVCQLHSQTIFIGNCLRNRHSCKSPTVYRACKVPVGPTSTRLALAVAWNGRHQMMLGTATSMLLTTDLRGCI